MRRTRTYGNLLGLDAEAWLLVLVTGGCMASCLLTLLS
jgi:hypothetical protein